MALWTIHDSDKLNLASTPFLYWPWHLEWTAIRSDSCT